MIKYRTPNAHHVLRIASVLPPTLPLPIHSLPPTMASFKRARSPQNIDLSPSPSPTNSPTPKLARASATPPPGGQPSTSTPGVSHSGILCTLPPTCNPPHRPTALAGTHELEAHYAMYHAHVCEQKGCGCVFPDARLLELVSGNCSALFWSPKILDILVCPLAQDRQLDSETDVQIFTFSSARILLLTL